MKKNWLKYVKKKLTFSFAVSADSSLLMLPFEMLDFKAISTCSWSDGYMAWTVSNKKWSRPCLAIKDTETGSLSCTPKGMVTCKRFIYYKQENLQIIRLFTVRLNCWCTGRQQHKKKSQVAKQYFNTWQQPDMLAIADKHKVRVR